MREMRFLLPVTLASVCIGFASSGAVIWLPTYINDTALFPESLVGAIAGVLPLFGLLGILLSGALIRRFDAITHVVILMLMVSIAVLIVASLLPVHLQLVALTVAIILISGATGVTLSAIPIMTAWQGRTSSVAGTLSAANSLGGGLAGVAIGMIVQQGGWSAVFMAWAVSLVMAIGLIHGYGRALARQKEQ
jgi:sugar phosphate permease